jgi:hypothetical protein
MLMGFPFDPESADGDDDYVIKGVRQLLRLAQQKLLPLRQHETPSGSAARNLLSPSHIAKATPAIMHNA